MIFGRIGLALAFLLFALPSHATEASGGVVPACHCAPKAELAKLRDRIAAAPSIADARELAVEPVAQARRILARLVWASDSIRGADARMAAYEASVLRARTPAETAAQFGVLVRLDAPAIASRTGHAGCSYSTGEIIAIVLGFILAIIPGIILLILLC
jgi:hypothetical protein